VLCALDEQPQNLLRQSGFDAVIGDANLQLDLASALVSALVSALAPRPAVGAA